MPGWNDYAREGAEVGSGGEWPEIADDLYDSLVQDVSEPEEGADMFNPGKTRIQFYVTWELASGDVPEGTTLRQYISLPETYVKDGFVSDKSNLYKVMSALGFEMEGKFVVDPPTWQGMKARVMIENKPNASGDMRPRITDVKPPRQIRQPAGARR